MVTKSPCCDGYHRRRPDELTFRREGAFLPCDNLLTLLPPHLRAVAICAMACCKGRFGMTPLARRSTDPDFGAQGRLSDGTYEEWD